MYNSNFPFIPDPNLMNMNISNNISKLEDNINKLNREIKRLEHRITKLENKNYPYISTNKNNNYDDDSGMYMM